MSGFSVFHQVVHSGVPLVHLPAGGAAFALQPDALIAGIGVFCGLFVAVLCSVPPAYDVRKSTLRPG
jgi:hypothetical protein